MGRTSKIYHILLAALGTESHFRLAASVVKGLITYIAYIQVAFLGYAMCHNLALIIL